MLHVNKMRALGVARFNQGFSLYFHPFRRGKVFATLSPFRPRRKGESVSSVAEVLQVFWQHLSH